MGSAADYEVGDAGEEEKDGGENQDAGDAPHDAVRPLAVVFPFGEFRPLLFVLADDLLLFRCELPGHGRSCFCKSSDKKRMGKRHLSDGKRFDAERGSGQGRTVGF